MKEPRRRKPSSELTPDLRASTSTDISTRSVRPLLKDVRNEFKRLRSKKNIAFNEEVQKIRARLGEKYPHLTTALFAETV